MRKAGDLIREYLREGQLAANRSEPIGSGAYGVVYASDVPGNVMKQAIVPDIPEYKDVPGERTLEQEANLQAIAAEMGIAPRVAGLEKFPGGIGNRIEMADVRQNYEALPQDPMIGPQSVSDYAMPGTRKDLQKFAVRQAQQMGQLALKGVRLEDRHDGNVMRHKMTGRPMQIDFGIAGRVEGSEQVATLANATAEGFEAAGLGDVASIYRATVMDLLEGGDVADAMDVAKQGFSRLQKIGSKFFMISRLTAFSGRALCSPCLISFDADTVLLQTDTPYKSTSARLLLCSKRLTLCTARVVLLEPLCLCNSSQALVRAIRLPLLHRQPSTVNWLCSKSRCSHSYLYFTYLLYPPQSRRLLASASTQCQVH